MNQKTSLPGIPFIDSTFRNRALVYDFLGFVFEPRPEIVPAFRGFAGPTRALWSAEKERPSDIGREESQPRRRAVKPRLYIGESGAEAGQIGFLR